MDAMELLRCEEDEKRIGIPKDYFDLLKSNKNSFDDLIRDDEDDRQDNRGLSNIVKIIRRLKTPEIRNCKQYTKGDEIFIREVLSALDMGRIPKKDGQLIWKLIEVEVDPLKVLHILRDKVAPEFLILDKVTEENGINRVK